MTTIDDYTDATISVTLPRFVTARTRTGDVQIDLAEIAPAAFEHGVRYGFQQWVVDKSAGKPDAAGKLATMAAFVEALYSPNWTPRRTHAGPSGGLTPYIVDAARNGLASNRAPGYKAALFNAAIKGLNGPAREKAAREFYVYWATCKIATKRGVKVADVPLDDMHAALVAELWDKVIAMAKAAQAYDAARPTVDFDVDVA